MKYFVFPDEVTLRMKSRTLSMYYQNLLHLPNNRYDSLTGFNCTLFHYRCPVLVINGDLSPHHKDSVSDFEICSLKLV